VNQVSAISYQLSAKQPTAELVGGSAVLFFSLFCALLELMADR
jgi:hypothetical protein